MVEPTLTPESEAADPPAGAPKDHFAKAVAEAKVGAQLLGKQAQERAEAYREKLDHTRSELGSEARAKRDEARERALHLAQDGKARAAGAISSFGRVVEDNAAMIDERLGVTYGDYLRSAGQSIQDAAGRLDAKELDDIVEDAREFVRSRPGLAVGLAAVSGFMLARMFKSSDD